MNIVYLTKKIIKNSIKDCMCWSLIIITTFWIAFLKMDSDYKYRPRSGYVLCNTFRNVLLNISSSLLD